jgi:hypothetical protein
MWLPGPTRAVLLSTLVVGLLVVFAVYAALDVSRDVHVIYEAEPYHPVVHGPYHPVVHGPVDVPLLPTQPSRRLFEMILAEPDKNDDDFVKRTRSVVEKHMVDTHSAFYSEMVAFQKAKDFCEKTRMSFTLGDGTPHAVTYSFSQFMQERAPQGLYRRFIAARQFYDMAYEYDWKKPPTIPRSRRRDLLPRNIRNLAARQRLWRSAFIYFFTDTDGEDPPTISMPLHALFDDWQSRGDAIKLAYQHNDDSHLDDLPHNP